MLDNIMEYSVPLHVIVANPWFIGVASVLAWYVGGTLYCKYLIHALVKGGHDITRKSDTQITSGEVIHASRFLFPISIVPFLFYNIFLGTKRYIEAAAPDKNNKQ